MCKKRLSRGKPDPWQRPFHGVFWVPSRFEALFKFQKVLFKCFFRRVSSRPCYFLAFLDTIFYVWSVARGKVCKLKKVSVSERKRKQNVIYITFAFSMLSFALLDGCGTFRMLHILCSFLLLEVYLSTSQKRPLILELLNLSVWIFPYTQCHATSFPYLGLTMWLKFLADLVSLILSCFLDLGLIHQSWRRGWDLFLAKHKR